MQEGEKKGEAMMLQFSAEGILGHALLFLVVLTLTGPSGASLLQ